MNIIFTEHARFEIRRRQIADEDIRTVMASPAQRIVVKKKRVILQSKYIDKIERKEMLLRIVGREADEGFIIITTYKTSKVEKYWERRR